MWVTYIAYPSFRQVKKIFFLVLRPRNQFWFLVPTHFWFLVLNQFWFFLYQIYGFYMSSLLSASINDNQCFIQGLGGGGGGGGGLGYLPKLSSPHPPPKLIPNYFCYIKCSSFCCSFHLKYQQFCQSLPFKFGPS